MRLRLEFSLSALLVIILLLHSTNGVEITEQDATVGSVPESTGPVPSPEQRTTTESSPENSLPNSRWYRRLGEIVKRLQGYKNYLFARNDNERSRVEQAAVDAVQPTFEMVEAGMSNPLVAELIQKSSGLSLPQPIVRFLTLIREKWLTIMMVSSFSSGFYNIYFAIYMTYMMFATFFKTLWAFKGTLALTAFTVPTVTYAIDQIKTFKAGTSSPTPDDDAAKTDPDQLEKNAAQTFNVAESLSDDHYFQQDQPGSGDSSTSWIWMVVLAFVGLLFVTATGYFVYKKMNRRRSEDVMEQLSGEFSLKVQSAIADWYFECPTSMADIDDDDTITYSQRYLVYEYRLRRQEEKRWTRTTSLVYGIPASGVTKLFRATLILTFMAIITIAITCYVMTTFPSNHILYSLCLAALVPAVLPLPLAVTIWNLNSRVRLRLICICFLSIFLTHIAICIALITYRVGSKSLIFNFWNRKDDTFKEDVQARLSCESGRCLPVMAGILQRHLNWLIAIIGIQCVLESVCFYIAVRLKKVS